MKHRLITTALICITLGGAMTSFADEPQWLWATQNREAGQRYQFRRDVELSEPVSAATMTLLAESARVVLEVNGRYVHEQAPYAQIARLDLTDVLRPGKNEITLSAESVAGPAAVMVDLQLRLASGRTTRLSSDRSWTVDSKKSVSFGVVDPRLLVEKTRRVGVSAVDNYEQWRRAQQAGEGTSPAAFVTTPGFEITLIRSSQRSEDSWISLAFDANGRAIISKEQQGLLRLTIGADGKVGKVETINDSLKECRGLLFAHDSLYANANNSKALYRLKQIDDDRFGEPELLYASGGGVGHGRNDIALGPDGKIYMIHGDAVRIPTNVPDYTSPYRDARKGKTTSEGHWLRVDPKTKQVEMLAGGLRNPYGIDFNEDGESFTYDADAEYDMGSPWYRPTRVSHLVVGADYGWRGVTRSWPPYYPDHPDNGVSNLDVGKGSPTAVLFGTKTNFPVRYRRALFVLDWAYGRVLAAHLFRRGASYTMSAETFLKGSPLNVTDLAAAPDGSMYLITGGRGTQSALYRIRYVGPAVDESPAAQTPQQQARAEFAAAAHQRRCHLQSLLIVDGEAAEELDDAWRSLGDADPWLRHAARNVIEQHPAAVWRSRALREPNLPAALSALTALARNAQDNDAVLKRLNELPWMEASQEYQTEALYCYWLATRNAQLDKNLLNAIRTRLSEALPAKHFAANRLLSELIVQLWRPEQNEKILQLLERTNVQHEKMHYLFVLRHSKWLSIEQRQRYFSALEEASRYLGGQGLPDFVRRIREESVGSLNKTERAVLKPWIEALDEKELPSPPAREFIRKWTLKSLTSKLDFTPTKEMVERGRKLFGAAACTQCHRADGVGRSIGPDLTTVARRFSRRDILTSIIHPSQVIAEKFQALQVVTKDGRTLVGRVATSGDYRSQQLRLAVDPMHPFKFVSIEKNEIEQQRPSPTSWMPEGLLNTLSESEIHDLLAYLESMGR